MLARIKTSSLFGIDAQAIDVEVRVSSGKRNFSIIGLGDIAIREARDRVFSALRTLGFTLPEQILVNLAPADLKKEGASFDLAIALGVLVASGQLKASDLSQWRFHGELSLDAAIRPVRGAVSLAIQSLEEGATKLVVPRENYAEAALVGFPCVIPVSSLAELIEYLNGSRVPQEEAPQIAVAPIVVSKTRQISDVIGQATAKRALLIAAAGGHNLLI